MTTQNFHPRLSVNRTKSLSSWLPISIIMAVAAALCTFQLGREGLWIDELFSIRDASIGGIGAVYQATSTRPLYYLLLSVWMQFGSSEAYLRSLSVIFAIISVFLIYRLGRRLDGEPTGLIAAGLLTLSPLFISHAQEVRMYVLSLCMGLAGTLFLANALLIHPDEQPSQKNLAGWALFRLLAIYTVPLNVGLLFPDVLVVLLRFRKRPGILLKFGAWLLVILALWSPSILNVASDAAPDTEYALDRERYLKPPGLQNLIYPLKFWMVPPQIVRLGKGAHWFYKVFTLPVLGVIGAGLIRKHKSPASFWMGAWFVLPLSLIVIYSRIGAQLWEPRYVLFASPYLFLLIAAGFARLWQQWRPAFLVIGAIYLFAMGWAIHTYYDVQNRDDYRFNIETIEQQEQPGDAIVWGYEWDDPLNYYYDGSANIYPLDMHAVRTETEVQQWVSKLPTDYPRLWIVLGDPEKSEDAFKSAITQKFSVEETYEDFGDFAQPNPQFDRGSIVMLVTPIQE